MSDLLFNPGAGAEDVFFQTVFVLQQQQLFLEQLLVEQSTLRMHFSL